jgi:hypothetical protein
VRALAFALALLSASNALTAEGPVAAPRKPDRRYVASGAALFGFFYALSLGLAIRYEEGELALPAIGPLVALRRCHECTASATERGVVSGLVLDAALQLAGASLFVVGMVRRRAYQVSIAPAPGGLLVRGRF